MGFQQLDNCPKCGKLFVRMRSICPDCIKKEENDFSLVATYLREYPGCTLQEVSEETKVTFAQIRQFILAGRIIVSDFPNLEYPCESCGTMIRKGRVCTKCHETINQLATEIQLKDKTDDRESKQRSAYRSHK